MAYVAKAEAVVEALVSDEAAEQCVAADEAGASGGVSPLNAVLGRPCGMGETMPLDVEILADQIRRAFWGESWHGPSVREVLAGVSAEDAAAHPIAGAHSIWEIVLHMTGGYHLVLRRVRGERAQLAPEEEWPPVAEVSSEAWRASQHTLDQLNQ